MLVKVLVVSAAIHVLGLFVLGGITVVRYIIPDEAQFEEPPEINEEKPPPEVKVEIKPKPQIKPMRDLRMKKVGNIAVADIAVDLPSESDSFTINAGIGGFGGASNLMGTGRGKLDFGSSQVNVFGLKARAERILFVIDTNRQMLTDKKGGLNSYRLIKDEITDRVGNLSAGTLFNVMLQDRTKTLLFQKNLVTASSDSHSKLVKWIAPINSNANNPGLESNYRAAKPTLKALKDEYLQPFLTLHYRGNETAFITQYALEQGIDTIFFITGYHRGFESVRRKMNPQEEEAWETKINSRAYIEQLTKHEQEVPQMEQRIRNELNRINAERKAKGQPPRVIDRRWGVYSAYNDLGLKWNTRHPGHRPYPDVDSKDITQYFRELNEELYLQYDKPVPSINVVLFLAEDEIFDKQAEQQLKDYVRFYEGKYRIIRGEKEIKSARSSQKNP
ncbi:MAG: Uncharacterised protein [Opitutia bacterium UBA7350]|nr:MAG: Uncharacterised protein [Opitutae bacterium UBA7350]